MFDSIDRQRASAAEIFFNNSECLEGAITEQVFPGLVVIETTCGRVGMGFFQYQQWLISNAHVIKGNVDIENGITLRKFDNTHVKLEAEQSFFRPWLNLAAPDLTAIKTHTNGTCIPQSALSLDATYQDTRYFYVDPDFVIHSLSLVSQLNQYPVLFRRNDNKVPQLGCSGTPIFSAKVIIGRQCTWKFEVVGAVYARCDNMDPSATRNEQPAKLVCAVPVKEDLVQIRQILINRNFSDYFQQRTQASSVLGDKQGLLENSLSAIQTQQLAAAGFAAFNSGYSPLEINLPEGMEKLAGSSLVPITESYLIKSSDLTAQEAKETFAKFIDVLKAEQNICIKVQSETTIFSDTYWRLDCKPGTNGQYWVLQLQDNTGKGVKVLGTNKSASSVFAEVKVPRAIEHICGQALGIDLLTSQAQVQTKAKGLTTLTQMKGPKRKIFEKEMNELIISITAGQHPSCNTLEGYQQVEPILAATPRSLSLFKAIAVDATDGASFAAIERNSERANSVNVNGDTPLMVLLKDPHLLGNESQMTKAFMLAPYSIWTQANKAGKTADMMLAEHTEVNELTARLKPT